MFEQESGVTSCPDVNRYELNMFHFNTLVREGYTLFTIVFAASCDHVDDQNHCRHYFEYYDMEEVTNTS
jgi:hypothetical protein